MSDSEARYLTFLAYGLIAAWTILMVYVVTLAARERKLKQQINNVRNMIDDGAKK